MEKQVIDTSERPTVVVTAHSNLRLKGIDDARVTAAADSPDDLHIQKMNDEVRVTSQSNLTMHVPREAKVILESIHGNASLKGLDGELEIKNVYGDLQLRSVSKTKIHRVDGNLAGKHFDDDVIVDSVSGNAALRDLEGFTVNNRIDGNLALADFNGPASFVVSGNATIRMDPQPGEHYSFTADGNILVRLPEDASAALIVERADGGLRIKVGDTNLRMADEFPFRTVLGEGDAEIVLKSDGQTTVIGRAPDWELSEDFDADIGGEFEGMVEELSQQAIAQMEAQMEMLERHLNAQMENLSQVVAGAGISAEQAARISERAREASARATARAQERMQRAQERIRRKIEVAQRKAEAKARAFERRGASARRGWDFNVPPRPERPADPVTEEERLLILKMLEDKRITAEEADSLLAALEGREG